MSTTFDVYPRKPELPTFAAVLDRSTRELHRFLNSVDMKAQPRILVRLQRYEDHSPIAFNLQDEVRWQKDVYAWFMVEDVPGGTDASYEDSPEHILELWNGELENAKYGHFESAIRKTMQVGHSWSFRRSAGQWAITNIAYGLIAASLATLTEGFVHSIDSAWDGDRLPAFPEDFLKWYFRPELALEGKNRSWSEQCIAHLSQELSGNHRR